MYRGSIYGFARDHIRNSFRYCLGKSSKDSFRYFSRDSLYFYSWDFYRYSLLNSSRGFVTIWVVFSRATHWALERRENKVEEFLCVCLHIIPQKFLHVFFPKDSFVNSYRDSCRYFFRKITCECVQEFLQKFFSGPLQKFCKRNAPEIWFKPTQWILL